MKYWAQTVYLPVFVAVTLIASASASAGNRAARQAKPKPTAEQVKFSDLSLIGPAPGSRNKPTDRCKSGLKSYQDKTAWQRGFDQAYSGSRALSHFSDGFKQIPESGPCSEYTASGFTPQDVECCNAGFLAGHAELRSYLKSCFKPDTPEATECFTAYNEGVRLAIADCDMTCPAVESDKVGSRGGCLAMGFKITHDRCDSPRQPASSTNKAALSDHRFKRNPKYDVKQIFKLNGGSAGSADGEICEDDEAKNPFAQ